MYDECVTDFIWVEETRGKFLWWSILLHKANFYKDGKVGEYNYFAYSLGEEGYGADAWCKTIVDGRFHLTFKPRMEIYLTDGTFVSKSFNSYDEMNSYYIDKFNGYPTIQIFGDSNIKYENGVYNGKCPRLW